MKMDGRIAAGHEVFELCLTLGMRPEKDGRTGLESVKSFIENNIRVKAKEDLRIIYKNNKPYGIRDESGYLFFFADISKFPNEEERYRKEVQEQYVLADYLLSALRAQKHP
jgi:hypothetical protein